MPSAGAFYTYVTRGLGPRAGFITGGLMFVAYALLPPAEIGLIGSYLQSTLRAELHVNVPWWLIGLVPAAADGRLAFEGIRSSLRTALVLFAVEVCVVVLLAVIVVGKGGHGRSQPPPAHARRVAERLQRPDDRLRVRGAELRRLRGRGDARRRGPRSPAGSSRAPYC